MWRIWTLHTCWNLHSLLYSGFNVYHKAYLLVKSSFISFLQSPQENWGWFPKTVQYWQYFSGLLRGESQEKSKCILCMYSIIKSSQSTVLCLSLPSVLHNHNFDTEQSVTHQWHCGFNLVLTYCSLPLIKHVRYAQIWTSCTQYNIILKHRDSINNTFKLVRFMLVFGFSMWL